ncbi:MAG TPA: PadR family transcriptional regulator [Symbiobacteriaceae bacterium]|nr:PadR family transcriptional regulator [Symbiobacteriaceae bacterium]
MEAWDTQLRKGGLELAVLLLLSRHRMYGLELIGNLTDAGFSVSEGTIYPLLSRLSGQGAIAAEWVTGESGHPRKYYRLTGAGMEQTSRMVGQWTEFAAALGRLVHPTRFAPGKEAQA